MILGELGVAVNQARIFLAGGGEWSCGGGGPEIAHREAWAWHDPVVRLQSAQ